MTMPHPLLRRAQVEGAPLIKGKAATFIWRGRQGPRLVGDFNCWDPSTAMKLERVAPGVWAAALDLTRDAYMEYTYLSDDEHTLDPLNPRLIPNGLGQKNNFFYMPEGAPSPLLETPRGPRGRVTRHIMLSRGPDLKGEFVGRHREVHLYQPPTAGPYPLMVVYDGRDYLHRGRLPRIVDNLIAQRRIPPLALAMVSHGGPHVRGVEYACNEATAGFVVNQVLPLARGELNLVDPRAKPGAFGVMGASLGGLMALYTALRHPAIFGKVLSQSGGFGVDNMDTVVFDLIRDGAPKPLSIWMDYGRYDYPSLIPSNRRMHALLQAKGYPVTCSQYSGGHNYACWRNEAGRGLEALFGRQA